MSLTRRGFLGNIFGSMAAAVVAPSIVEAAVESLAKPASVAVAPAVGYGIPNCYPLCMSTPLDRAYLMPFDACLFDSEYGCDDNLETQLFFNQKQYRAIESGLKQETNIWQSMMLDYPREFKAKSLGIFVNGEVNRHALVSLKAHLSTPEELNNWDVGPNYPHNLGLNTLLSRKLKYFPRDTTGRIMERVSHYSYSQANRCVENNSLHSDFCLPLKHTLLLKPGDAFKVTIKWTERPPKDARITAALNGVLFVPCSKSEFQLTEHRSSRRQRKEFKRRMELLKRAKVS